MSESTLLAAFAVVIAVFLVVDLGILNRKGHAVGFKESLLWTLFWSSLAFLFAGGIDHWLGRERAINFVTGYLVELSLSMDNLFVFLLIFSAFKIPGKYQHRVLFWGILGAIVMRAVCILAGIKALEMFSWLVYVFGAILVFGGVKTALKNPDEDDDPSEGFVVSLVKKFIPVTDQLHGEKFFVRPETAGRLHATPLFVALVVVEISDLIFAVDSVPAVLAITTDTFVVYTSNVFAILGLRSLYFALANLMQLFRFLRYALAVILVFVGIKITISHFYKIPVEVTLGVVIGLILLAILMSLVLKPAANGAAAEPTDKSGT